MENSTSCIHIKNFLGVRSLMVPLEKRPIAIIGRNATGKSSALTAIGAILSGNDNPLGIKQSTAYLHDGTEYGEVVLEGPAGQELRRWQPTARGISKFPDTPGDMSVHAMNLVNFLALKSSRERAEIWESIILPPQQQMVEMLEEALRENPLIPPGTSEIVLREIKLHGNWDTVEKLHAGHAREAKREWSEITGEPFGVKKARVWRPHGWSSRLDGMTAVEARAEVAAAEEMWVSTHRAEAIEETEQAAAKQAKQRIPGLEAELTGARESLAEAEKDYADKQAQAERITVAGKEIRSQLDRARDLTPSRDDSVPCPHCGQGLVIDSEHKIFAEESEKDFELRLDKWRKKTKKLSERLVETQDAYRQAARPKNIAKAKRDKLRDDHAVLEARLRQLRATAEDADKPVKTAALTSSLEIAQQQLEDRRRDLALIEKRHEAESKLKSVLAYSEAAAILGHKGIRQSLINRGLDGVRKTLMEICTEAKWKPIEIDADYSITYRGRPGILASGSERWRIQIAMAIAVAVSQDDRRVLMDTVDILDWDQWQIFFRVCRNLTRKYSIFPIVAATAKPNSFPEDWLEVVIEDGGAV